MGEEEIFASKDEKAAYNQAGLVTEVLGNLRKTYIGSKLDNDLSGTLNTIRAILDVISGKAKEEQINPLNEEVYKLEALIIKSDEKYNSGGGIYYRNPQLRMQVKRAIENLYRRIEKLQDKLGYGMPSLDDPRFAVLQR